MTTTNNLKFFNMLKKGDQKLINAWAFYDWANSVYSLVISTAVFPLYYSAIAEGKVVTFLWIEWDHPDSLYSYALSFSFLVVAFISPILSGIADYTGSKKKFMKFFCWLGALSVMSLYFFEGVDTVWIGILFTILASIGFWASLVFYNAYLPEIAEKKVHDKISAQGFSMGYIGSVLLLLICLVLVLNPETFGFSGAGEASRFGFLLTGVWWFGFSHIFFFRIKEESKMKKITKQVLSSGFKELKVVYKEFMGIEKLKRFLPAFFMISTGVQTVMLVATYFAGKEIDWADEKSETSGLIISILLIQIVAILGALVMSKVSQKIGNIKSLQFIVFAWACIVIWAYFIHSPLEFYITAALVGLVMGSVQALSRSTYSKFLPETEDTSSYFSFYDVTEKIGIVVGLFLFGFLEQVTGDMRISIVAVGIFFVIAFILLSFVPKDKAEKSL